MSFTDSIYEIAKKVRDLKSTIETEEATKNAFVMPFISKVLGYDVFNPNEVVPEFHCDVGTKRGEKIDYAVMKDGKVCLLIECKKVGEVLTLRHASQLFRYFATTDARIAILTNGQEYQVYTDGDVPNRMDEKPFLVFDLLNIDSTLVPELQKLSKEAFDLDSVMNVAEELKYIGMIKRIIAIEVKDPSNDWLRFFIGKVYAGNATQKVMDQFRPLIVKAINQYINGQVNDRLQNALGDDAEIINMPGRVSVVEAPAEPAGERSDDVIASDIITTDEELEGFNIVRAIAVAEVPPERVVFRDAKSYFAVLLDDNNRKPIIRLHLNSQTTKYVTTFEADNTGVRHDIQTVIDIYNVTDLIRKAIRRHENT
ncbi:type I restriction enzyme HsdR N-terminal domain-containing protein [Mycobacterium koreense]|uniref:Restriction endonuclease n=1 Tax=Mycolicibacillus koreensis TaxID=1069220 RepID=A0A7I7SEE0_9MYCO|nr:type I restriction endonuclease [Mycolicibacillus koreensis]MCV7246799.1 type I restriction enzyme HsdR N-terminal domain-containing protein [Mycolicibacillus koreensis]OSC35410.1 restriction endonuclease [Mycolicibacillus koreensis]BBY54335.1 hypothetical protein MKOR_15860 [Mycolicibacillus koreensis]